ncbi:hypothetical protein EZS27_011263 [termite gut metagenome]|uniref:Helix-turn-helix domain-containing protein n=1 Tax=termite gut metagenome TaxID=433724 RepID=A0A5J4S4D9_9ZZZZ
MELKMIEGRSFDRLKQCVTDLLERSNKLNPSQTQREWLDNQDICCLLGISLRTLQNYRDKGLIPYSQTGHKCYYKAKDIERFLEENRHINPLK